MKNGHVTIKDIAAKAMVSIGTVDRVIHNRGRVDNSTAQRVRKIIKELGYKPNIFASHLSRARVYNFGVVIPKKEQDSKYWAASITGIEKAAKELHHYNIDVKYFFYDRYAPEKFPRIIRKIADGQFDALLVAPLLIEPIRKLVGDLKKSFPYAFINTALPELSPLTFIGQDSFQSGLVCGKLMKLLIHTGGTVATIIAVPNDKHIHQRADGFRTAFRDDSLVTVKEYELFQLYNPENAAHSLDKIFEDNPDLAGIFVANVATHYVAAYLQKRNLQKKIYLAGYDLIEENIHFLNTNIIDFLISQKPEQQGYEGIYALYRHVILKDVCPKEIFMPIDIITKENLLYYHNG